MRMMDAEHAMQVEEGSVGAGVDPGLLNIRAVGEVVASFGGVCRTVDAGVAQMEIAIEVVAVGVSHLAIADGAFEFLADGVAKLPAANVDGFVVHDMSFLSIHCYHSNCSCRFQFGLKCICLVNVCTSLYRFRESINQILGCV